MLIKRVEDVKSSEITPEHLYLGRREFIRAASAAGLGLASAVVVPQLAVGQDRWPKGKKGPYDVDEEVNTFKQITTYNNFYEFGVDKSDPEESSGGFRPNPWTVRIEGQVEKPAGFTAFVLMIPLALTSPNRIAKWIGGRRWQLIHRLVYATALGGVIHYLWLVKADTRRPAMYGVMLSVLLAYRVWDYLKSRRDSMKLVPRGETHVA